MKRHTHLTFVILLVILAAAASLRADDTEIYGLVSTSIPPNVLIIFDTSGSMATSDVPGDPYVSTTTYSGSYPTNAVYYKNGSRWDLFTNSVDNILCAGIKSNLLSIGYTAGKLKNNFSCGGNNRTLRLGNFMNYNASGIGLLKTRISVAKQVLTDLISQTNDVRFGMMVYNYNDSDANSGGHLVEPCADRQDSAAKQPLLNAVASATPSGWTPLAETLAEAGLYFAGKPSWFNTSGFPTGTYTGGHYVSPMQQRCQKNYVILMTDGEPTMDRHHKLYDTAYINGDLIGDQDGDHANPCSGFTTREYWYRDVDGNCHEYDSSGSDYLDDVANYLYRNDCNPDLGTGTSFEKQNIVTYTIGFKVANQLLSRTAEKGGGEYFTADNYSALSEAFSHIMAAIVERNSCFVAPVVPVSRTNRTYAGNKIYLGFFKPQQDGCWFGNLKRYKLDNDGTIRDQANILATNTYGLIQEDARSWWSSADDGPAVEKGGAAERLGILIDTGGTRNIYTYTGTAELLTDASNAFVSSNSAVTNGMLEVTTDPARVAVFDTVRRGEFGDVIHSEPAVVYYGPGADGLPDTADDVVKIFVGANDGMLHCIDDVTGNEDWAFIPPEHLGRLKKLTDTVPDHDYFVDGSPTVYFGDSQKILIIGSRRGGESYTAIDITTYNAPRYLYTVGPTILGSGNERLGQSWSRPERATIATGPTITTVGCSVVQQLNASNTADVLLFGGGYDTNQDDRTASPPADIEGRAVFAANLTTGMLMNNLKFSYGAPASLGMTNSVVDVAGFDHDGDGIVSRIYFGDLGGNVFALRDDVTQEFTICSKTIKKSVVDGTWAGVKLFNASADGVKRKIFYAPDAVAETYPPGTQGEYIYFGTGDRENPGNTTVVNRIYAVKNDWPMPPPTSPLTETNLVDVTENLIQLGTAEQKEIVRSQLNTEKGWFIRLQSAGEKVVSTPRVYGGVVYFTTYTPGQGEVSADPCEASTANGTARLYAVDFKTGAAVHNFSVTAETDGTGNTVALGKLDRSTVIGTAIPSAPVIAILKSGAYLFIGVEGGISSMPVVAGQDMYRYYWNQIF